MRLMKKDTEGVSTTNLTVLSGIGAAVVTVIMATGKWSILDFGVSASIISFALYFFNRQKVALNKKIEVLLFAFPFALLSAAGLSGLFVSAAYELPNG